MKFHLNSLSGTADRKLHVGLFSQSQLNTLSSRPYSSGKSNSNQRKIFKSCKNSTKLFIFHPCYNSFLFITRPFCTEYKFSHAILSRIRPRKLQPQVTLAWTAYLKFLPQYSITQKFKHSPNCIKNENYYSKPEHRLNRI